MTSADTVAQSHRNLVREAKAAVSPRGIVERLVSAIGGWALLLDEQGALLAAVPPIAAAHLTRVQAELDKFGNNSQVPTMAIRTPGESVIVAPIGVRGRIRGFLVIGRGLPLDTVEKSLVHTTTFLLAGDQLRSDDLRQAARNNRKVVLDLLVDGATEVVHRTASTLGVRVPEGPVRIALLSAASSSAAQLLEAAEENQALRRIVRVITQQGPGNVVMVFPEAEGDLRTLETILRSVPQGRGAVSAPTPLADLPAAWARIQAIIQTVDERPGILHVAGHVADSGLLRHLATPEAREWSASMLEALAELDRGSRVDFTATLRAFLSNNGKADGSAAELGIHRHTFRYRMERIADALQRDLDDPTVRSELWIALQLSRV